MHDRYLRNSHTGKWVTSEFLIDLNYFSAYSMSQLCPWSTNCRPLLLKSLLVVKVNRTSEIVSSAVPKICRLGKCGVQFRGLSFSLIKNCFGFIEAVYHGT